MVSFRKIFTAALVATTAVAQTTPAQVVVNIKTLTAKSQAIQIPAKSISIVNGPLIVIGLGPFPPIIAGFADIIATVGTYLVQMQGMPAVPAGAASDAIFDAFREFVYVHQQLLNILIGKAGLFTIVPIIGGPVAAVLRQLEAIVDTVALGLISAVQSRANDLKTEGNALKDTIEVAINSYQGVANVKREIAAPVSRVKRAMIAAN